MHDTPTNGTLTNGAPALLPSKDVARLLRISRRTVWRWLAAGIIPPPCERHGNRVLWRREDLEPFVGDWLTARQVAGRLDVSLRTVWRWLAAGLLPEPVRFTRWLILWRRQDVEAYLAENPNPQRRRTPQPLATL